MLIEPPSDILQAGHFAVERDGRITKEILNVDNAAVINLDHVYMIEVQSEAVLHQVTIYKIVFYMMGGKWNELNWHFETKEQAEVCLKQIVRDTQGN